MLRKPDFLLILLLMAASFLPLAILGQPASSSGIYADITLDGSLYKRVPLTAHHGREELELRTDYGSNTVVIENETIAITGADCPDQLCVSMGKASRPGDTLVCLPHKLVIEVRSSGDAPAPDIIPAH